MYPNHNERRRSSLSIQKISQVRRASMVPRERDSSAITEEEESGGSNLWAHLNKVRNLSLRGDWQALVHALNEMEKEGLSLEDNNVSKFFHFFILSIKYHNFPFFAWVHPTLTNFKIRL